jgi:hypothetical protein
MSGERILSEEGAAKVSKARRMLVEARKLVAKAHAVVWEVDLHYS